MPKKTASLNAFALLNEDPHKSSQSILSFSRNFEISGLVCEDPRNPHQRASSGPPCNPYEDPHNATQSQTSKAFKDPRKATQTEGEILNAFALLCEDPHKSSHIIFIFSRNFEIYGLVYEDLRGSSQSNAKALREAVFFSKNYPRILAKAMVGILRILANPHKLSSIFQNF